MLRIGVLASGEGTTLQALLDAFGDGAAAAKVVLVISNNSQSGALRRARAAGIAGLHLSSHTHPDEGSLDAAICRALVDARVDVVLLAGYMKKLGPAVLRQFDGRVLNTHPALLPDYGGPGAACTKPSLRLRREKQVCRCTWSMPSTTQDVSSPNVGCPCCRMTLSMHSPHAFNAVKGSSSSRHSWPLRKVLS